jgi:hypothetical protein
MSDAIRTRADRVRRLAARPGDDLVFVSYGAGYSRDLEWVYNGADPSSSPVIFVHDRGGRNQMLMDIYPNRAAWIVRVSEHDIALEPYRPPLPFR